jgi:hypothetical protein
MPDMDEGDESEGTLVFRPRIEPGLVLVGKKVSLRLDLDYDDDAKEKNKKKSRAVSFVFSDKNANSDDGTELFNQPNVTVQVGAKVTLDSDIFEPDEFCDTWYTKPDNISIGLGRFKATVEGKLVLILDTVAFETGSYVVVARGTRSSILVVAVVIIITTAPPGTTTPDPSVTPSVTPSTTPSVSPSTTPSVSPSITPSVSPSVTVSQTPTTTVSVTPTVSLTPSPSAGNDSTARKR